VVVDAGDFLQGNPLAYVAARVDTQMPHPVIAAMNAIGYDAVVIGNHEFNYGLPALQRAMRQADFSMLAANVYTTEGKPRFRGWAVSTRQGIKIAIVGATTPGSMLWDRDNLAGQLIIRDIVPDVRTAVREARDAGAAVVIVVVHSGLNEPSSYDTVATHVPSENVAARLAREVPGIDLLVYGHSHKEMADTVIGTTLLMQPKNWATSVAIAHLGMQRRNGRWHVVSKRSRLVAAVRHREQPVVAAVTQEGHRATIAYATAPIGTTPVAWRADSARVVDTPLIDFILEVERRAAGAQLASTAAFSLEASLAAGPITVARLSALYPYDNTLRAVRVSGAQLRAYLEQSARYYRRNADGSIDIDPDIPGFNYDIVAGVDYTIDVSKPFGERITTLEFGGRPVAPTDTFTMALNNYRQTGGGGFAMLRDAPVVYDRQLEIRQLLIDEVRRKGTLLPSDYFHPNWRIVPEAAISRLLKTP
jgi:2',3'-cyclic-nucleotide 2'-phosphodiesterase/3'-nucleotidase